MTMPACQCEWKQGAKRIVCPRHLDHDGKPLRKLSIFWQHCNAGARGESPGIKYWLAWEEGRGPGQRKVTDARKRAAKRPNFGLGIIIEWALATIGFDRKHIEQWIETADGCSERRDRRHNLGQWSVKLHNALKTQTCKTMGSALRHNREVENAKAELEELIN